MIATWNEQRCSALRLVHAWPPFGRVHDDGSIEIHIIVQFGWAMYNPLYLHHLRDANGQNTFDLYDQHPGATLGQLQEGMRHEYPQAVVTVAGTQMDPETLIRAYMHIVIYTDANMEEDDFSSLQLWHSSDRVHGRTVGLNSWRQLPPPGNGKVTFLARVLTLDADTLGNYMDRRVENYFIDDFAENFNTETMDKLDNPFMADFCAGLFHEPIAQEPEGWLKLRHDAFRNPFAYGLLQGLQHPPPMDDLPMQGDNPSPLLDQGPAVQLVLHRLLDPNVQEIHINKAGLQTPDFLRQPHLWKQTFEIPDTLDLHVSTKLWLSNLPPADPVRQPGALHIYTDGSFMVSKDRAAWAFVVCRGHHRDSPPEQLQPIAWYSDLVFTDTHHSKFFGATWADSTQAEAGALIWAALFAIANHDAQELVFHFDSKSVGYAAAGQNSYTQRYDAVQNMRCLFQTVESIWEPHHVYYNHVKGHAGNPINELVNTLAQEQVHQWLIAQCPDLPLRDLVANGDVLRHLWLWINPLHSPTWPSEKDDTIMCPDRRTLKGLEPMQDWTFGYGRVCPHARNSEIWLDFRVITHNVRSLKGKVAYYRAQMHHGRYSLIGVQESASPEARTTMADGYMRLTSAAVKGHGGLEIWLAVDIPVAWNGQKPIFWDLHSVVVVYNDHRLLLIKVVLPGVGPFLIIAGHAPHSGHESQDKAAWWQKLSHLMQTHGHGHLCIGLLDANAQLGSCTSSSVGGFAMDTEDENGTHLHALAELGNMWIPATFTHYGNPNSWHGNASKLHEGRRIDFIAWPQLFRHHYVTSWTADDVDVGHQDVDHTAMALACQGPLASWGGYHKKGDGIDWREIRTHS